MKVQNRKSLIEKTALITATVMCSGCIVVSAMAGAPGAYTEGPVSNVWLSAVEIPSEAKLSITVPISYGFVVMGSVDLSENNPVKSEDGTILLPNVYVQVNTPSGSGAQNGEYTLTTVGFPQMPIENYSTDVREENMLDPTLPREGLPVEVRPYVVEVPDTLIAGVTKTHYWKPIETNPTGDTTLLKKYRLGLDGKWFSVKGQVRDEHGRLVDAFFIEQKLPLSAPPDVGTNGWNAAGLANVPSRTYFDMDVQVGGVRNQYTQVEQSVKIGEIGWEIIPGTLPTVP